MRKLVVLFLLSSFTLVSQKEAWNDVPQKLLELYNSAYKKSRKKDFKEAISDLTKAININPNYRAAFVLRGSMYKNLKRYNKALLDYSKSLEISDFNSYRTLMEIGYIQFELKNYSESFKIFNKIEKGGIDVGVKYMKALSAYHLKKYNIAIAWFDKSILFGSNEGNSLGEAGEIEAFYYKANAEMKLEKYGEAIKDYDIVISRIGRNPQVEKDKLYASAHYERGLAKRSLKLPYVIDFYKACELGCEKACFFDSTQKVKIELPAPKKVLKVSFDKVFKKRYYDFNNQEFTYKKIVLEVDSEQHKDDFFYSVEIKTSTISSIYDIIKFQFKNSCVPVRFFIKLKNGDFVEQRMPNNEIEGKNQDWDNASKITLFNFDEIEYIRIVEDECGLQPVELRIECFSSEQTL